MSLTLGTRLGPYEVTAQIGVGGMGEVYRATDTNLARQVAIKVLPEAVAADAERLARFDREAKTLAALNHPNIAAIYGLEKSASTTALVMELVEGPTLADRIGNGPMPIDQALPIAKQIAEALEAAHERGIIHPPEGFVSPMTWRIEANVIERFGAAGVPAERISFVKDTYTFRSPGPPSALLADFRTCYGPTMNAFAAAEQSGKTADLQQEREALFERENKSEVKGATAIPATFLRVTVVPLSSLTFTIRISTNQVESAATTTEVS